MIYKIIKLTIPILVLLIFSKNANRVVDRVKNNYFNNPWINIYSDNYEKKITYKKIFFLNSNEKYYYAPIDNEICYYAPAPCTHRVKKNLKIKKIANYDLIVKNY